MNTLLLCHEKLETPVTSNFSLEGYCERLKKALLESRAREEGLRLVCKNQLRTIENLYTRGLSLE